MTDFKSLGLPQFIIQSLDRLKFTSPTPIQTQAIPLALQGRDILGSAQTGTGKTAAFSIPLAIHLMENPQGNALVLAPTRELALQVLTTLRGFLDKRIRTALLIGGESMGKQFSQLRNNPRLVVGTPGRINDHLNRGVLRLNHTNFLVLDETDRMLDSGFGIQLDQIVAYLPKERQTMMFSATMPQNIIKLSAKYLINPERVCVGSTTAPTANIKQEIIHTSESEKYTHLLKQLEQRQGSIIVFVKTKRGAERLLDKVTRENHSADTLHGDLKQSRRDRVIQAFRSQKYRIMVATDVAARGLDIPHIEHVINYDLPQCPEDYIHRIGRTARAGAEGAALCLITPSDVKKWALISKLMNPNAPAPSFSPNKKLASPKPSEGKSKRFNKNTSGNKTNSSKKSEKGNSSYKGKKKVSFQEKSRKKSSSSFSR